MRKTVKSRQPRSRPEKPRRPSRPKTWRVKQKKEPDYLIIVKHETNKGLTKKVQRRGKKTVYH